jgi:hypothetical protein
LTEHRLGELGQPFMTGILVMENQTSFTRFAAFSMDLFEMLRILVLHGTHWASRLMS